MVVTHSKTDSNVCLVKYISNSQASAISAELDNDASFAEKI